MSQEPPETVDVVVVGAGISGLYAANLIRSKRPDLKIIVLEAKSKVRQWHQCCTDSRIEIQQTTRSRRWKNIDYRHDQITRRSSNWSIRSRRPMGYWVCFIESNRMSTHRTMSDFVFISSTQTNITTLLRDLNLQTYPQYHQGKSIAELRRRIHKYSLPIPYISLLSFLESIYTVFRVSFHEQTRSLFNTSTSNESSARHLF